MRSDETRTVHLPATIASDCFSEHESLAFPTAQGLIEFVARTYLSEELVSTQYTVSMDETEPVEVSKPLFEDLQEFCASTDFETVGEMVGVWVRYHFEESEPILSDAAEERLLQSRREMNDI